MRDNSVVPMIVKRGDLFGWDSDNYIDINIEIGHRAMCGISTLMVNKYIGKAVRALLLIYKITTSLKVSRSITARKQNATLKLKNTSLIHPVHPNNYARS